MEGSRWVPAKGKRFFPPVRVLRHLTMTRLLMEGVDGSPRLSRVEFTIEKDFGDTGGVIWNMALCEDAEVPPAPPLLQAAESQAAEGPSEAPKYREANH